MNERIEELVIQTDAWCEHNLPHNWTDRVDEYLPVWNEKFALLIVYDFLSELTNDDALGEARLATIKRLAEKWGVSR